MFLEKIQTVKGRFIFLILCSLLGALILAGIGLTQIEKVFRSANIGNKEIVPSVIFLDKIINEIGLFRTRVHRHVMSNNPAFMTKVEHELDESKKIITQTMTEYKQFVTDSNEKKFIEEEENAFTTYLNTMDPILTLSRQDHAAQAAEMLLSDEAARAYQSLYAILTKQMQYNIAQAQKASQIAQQEKAESLFLSLGIFIAVSLGLVLIGSFILRELKKQLGGEPKVVVEATGRIAQGDLSSVITLEKGDDTSLLASMNQMQQNLRILITDISTLIDKSASGDFTYQMNLENKKGFALEIGQKLNQVNQALLQQIGGNPEEGVRVASSIAAGNLDVSIQVRPHDRRSMMYAMSEMSRTLKTIISEIQEMVDAATMGQFHHKIDLTQRKGYAHRLGQLLNNLSDTTQEALSDISEIAQTLATGNLTKTIDKSYPGIFGESAAAINTTVNDLRQLIRTVIESINSISTAAGQIAAGNQDLSSRTEEQASSLEQTAASMEELTSVVRQNSENTSEANQLSQSAAMVATKGGEVVNESVQTMREITASSNRISEIITVIDGIAFQTNILALNAAVEAARAGELGKGFAVVATEVRSLSLRTTESAKQIKDLIQDSSVQVERGTEQANKAGETMVEIVDSIDSVSRLISEISNASGEQREGIEQVNKAIGQMDQVTQQNAALVEQVAAAAESLENQAKELKQQVSHFKI